MSWIPPEHEADQSLRKALPASGWAEAMRAICARHGLNADAGAGLAPFPTGSDIVWGAGEAGAGGFVIKMTHPRWAEEIVAEAAMLRHVGGRLRVAAPEVLATGALTGWPYVVTARLPGQAIGRVWPDLEPAERVRLAGALGEQIAELQSLAPLPAPENLSAAAWPAFHRRWIDDVLDRHARRGAGAGWLAQIPDLLAAAPRPERPLVNLHTELLDEHIFVQERGGRWQISGLIDFADGRVGHPDYELAAPVEFLFKGEPGCLGAMLSGIGWSATERADAGPRLAAWGLLHQFGHLPRMIAACPGAPRDFSELIEGLYRL